MHEQRIILSCIKCNIYLVRALESFIYGIYIENYLQHEFIIHVYWEISNFIILVVVLVNNNNRLTKTDLTIIH